MTQYRYGWKRQLPDFRDKKRALLAGGPVLPSKVDLTPSMPGIYDQGQLGSCTANAIAGALEYLQIKDKMKFRFTPSRLFIYYNEREMEGTVWTDSGAMIRDGIKSVNTLGVCPENGNSGWSWPYSDNQIQFRIKPWPACYKDALVHPTVTYEAPDQTEVALKSALAQGFPIVFGIVVYDSFESQQVSQTGDVPMPGSDESVLGGHAILIVGYDDERKRFIFRNSWGTGWGNKGYGTLPYEYVLNSDLSSDFWVIELTK